MDEAAKIKKRIYEQYLRPTLSDKLGWVKFITTPEGFNWIYELFLRGQSPEFPEWYSLQSSTYDNPYIPQGEVDDAKSELTKEYFQQEYLAQFTSFAGKVYPFDRSIHVKKLDYQKEWETFCSIDFGYRMPSVGWYQVGKVKGVDEVHLIDEISHEENIKTEDLADRIKAKTYPNVTYYGDPAGSGVQSQSGLGDIEIFKRKGIYVKFTTDPISRAISTGVGLVRRFLEDAKGEPHYFVSDRCVGHIVDYEGYRYPEKKEDRVLKDEPLKDGYHDHGCDETRYFFINRFPIRDRTIIQVRH